MKNLAGLPLAIVLIGATSFLGLPWWMTAVGGVVAGFWFAVPAGRAFAVGFAAGFFLWNAAAMVFNTANNGLLAGKMGQLFGGIQGWHLLTGTGALGGLLAGLGVLTGVYAREVLGRKAVV